MSSFTKGPWTIMHQAYLGNMEIQEACDGEHEANAHLISAAPEMYEALKSLVDTHDALTGGFGKSDPPAIRRAWSALEKAEGRG